MLIVIVGGKLQGVEAVYLAQKAGWETLVIDKNPDTPATGLCDHFLQFEFSPESTVPPVSLNVNFILPAVEDIDALSAITRWSQLKNIPLAFDLDAYMISSSKLKSNALFKKMKLSVPESWPGCSFPVVVKPDEASGSQGVEVINDHEALFFKFPIRQRLDNIVIQEFIDGPSYSIEVVGRPGNYKALQITDLSMDMSYDCKQVKAPTRLSPYLKSRLEEMAVCIAQKINLTGIMDLEVILNKEELKILEIDARFPSQTPMAVFWSTRINMVEILGNLVLKKENHEIVQKYEQYVIIEHIRFTDYKLEVCGEHIMALNGPLTLKFNFFGANEAITNYKPGKKQWMATLIINGNSQDDVDSRRQNCHEQIIKHSNNFFKE
jgi:3-methylornithine--L-lysine ligase